MDDEDLLLRHFRDHLQMRVEYSIRGFLLLTLRTHRKKSRRFVDYDDGVVQMHDSETVALERAVAGRFARGDGHDVAWLQLRIVTDRRLALHGYRAEAQKVLRLFARQSHRRPGERRQ